MILTVKNLVKRYKEKTALDHFNLEVREGEVLGLLGPNGCGKTTAINCILSLLTYSKGEIEIFGKPMTPNAPDIKQDIGLVPQEVSLFNVFTVKENVDYFCGLYVNDAAKRKALVDEAINFVGLSNYKNYKAKKLSGGLLRRLNIACGIAHKPRLIFMDEPTVAVDAQSRNFILSGIKDLAKNGSTIVYTTHYLEEAETLCDRVVIMDNGKDIANGTLDELKNLIKTREKIIVEFVSEPDNLESRLRNIKHVLDITKKGNDFIIVFENSLNNLNELISFINAEKLSYTKLYSEQPSLNDIFLELTGKELRDK
ncbi:ABC transporter ATP-binding protein [Treponema phagedenis]|uniref:ABC transporter ATP-binding protein n=1 Tax=Treponema phagedenis TaxID=162 RepID=UPI0011E7CBDF|nr:ABC transporter ATP-binding protein [Treponema phagedenis]QEK01635.1 ABC transporter ATP-binding protein [Treponema phagedenis]QSH95908.1 ABC transporter ATP-binding protein [Treponema phagedenis]